MRFLPLALLVALPACGPPAPVTVAPPEAVYRDETRFGLTFEERMAIPPALTRLKLDATRRADELYDPFNSRENAIRNEETAERLFTESRITLLNERGLTEEHLDEIIREYQASLGANLR